MRPGNMLQPHPARREGVKMRVPAFPICLCLLCALSVTSASADQKANALLRQVETTLAKAHSFKAEAISLGTAQPEASTLRLLRPGYYALVEGTKGRRQIIMNWKGEMMTYDETAHAFTRTGGAAFFEMGEVAPQLFFACSFLKPGLLRQLEQPTYAGEASRNGKTYRVIKTAAAEDRPALKLYISPQDILEGIESEAAHTKTLNLPGRQVWLRQVQVNAPLTPGDFVFTPPPGAQKTDSDDPVLQSPPCNALAPPFRMPGADGETLTLATLLNGKKAVLLNFTFGECEACVLEIPALKRLYADLKDKGLAVVAINILDNRETAQKFIAKYQLPYPMGLDARAGGGTEEVVAHYGVGSGGTNILIGADGRILWHEAGLNERYLRCVLEQAGIPALPR
jgi:peroxiredoxin